MGWLQRACHGDAGFARAVADTLKRRWPGIAYIALLMTSVSVFLTGAHVAATALIETQRSRQIEEMTETALRRSEVAVDYGIATLDELIQRGPMTCDPVSLQVVRLHVYQRGTVKDIRAVGQDGSVLCSAYSETLEFDRGWVARGDMLPAKDDAVRLFRVDQFFGVALGILKDVDASASLVAILGINAYLYDVMPAELRDHSDVVLELRNGQTIAQYSSPMQQGALQKTITFAKESDRYPLRTAIRVEAGAFNRWHQEPYLPIMGLALVLGIAFGLLLASAATRPPSPIAELDRALVAREFKAYLQPVFNMRSGAIVGCEALARWVQADGTVLPPSRFIPLAESSGRIVPLTWQIVSGALNDLQPLLKRDKNFKVSVNIVPHHLVTPGFVDRIREVVAQAKVSPRQVMLELTEREELEDVAKVASVVGVLRDFGFKVAIDDVGIGHNGLSHIQRLGANLIKIDKFFVDSIGRDATAVAIVEMLVRLARELKMNVVAEGVETDEQVAALLACEVEEGQGYLVSPPVAPADFLELVERHGKITASAAGDWRARPARVA